MRGVVLRIVCVAALVGAATADAAIYGWHDLQGVAHYVSDPEDVPPEYRAEIFTVVKDRPLPPFPAPSPEGSSALVDEPASPAPPNASDASLQASYDWGYRAGLDAAADAPPSPPVLSIVQNVQVVESAPPEYAYPVGLFGPVPGRGRFHPRRPISPMPGGAFLQGPAGPPPLGAPGPPPVSLIRR